MNWLMIRRASRPVALVALLTSSLLFAEQITVQNRRIDLLKGKGSMYLPPLATVEPGATLQVLGHEGRWCKVQYGSIIGYVLQGALDGTSGSTSYASAAGTGGSVDATASTAAKGWDEANWAQSRGYTRAGLDKMNAIRDHISANPRLWEQFKSEGHVGAR
jgi:hypothetical protein